MFWLMNHIFNPILLLWLGSPFGGAVRKSLLGLRVTGAKSGRVYQLVANYVQLGDEIYIIPAMPQLKTWWRNLRSPAAVQVLLSSTGWQPAGAQALLAPTDAGAISSALTSLQAAGIKPMGAPAPGEAPTDGFVLVIVKG